MLVKRHLLRIVVPLLLGGLALMACPSGAGATPELPAATSTAPSATDTLQPPTPIPPTASPAATLALTAKPTAEPTSTASATPLPTAGDPPAEPLAFVIGRNDYVITVDQTPREMLVYVPAGYDPNRSTPVVFMFHGTNQGGPLMYQNTAWAAKADQENFIVVFPTSWAYPLIGENGRHEKWNVVRLFELVQPGTELKDDVKFVRVMLAYLQATFSVDPQRLYATGFSNGGGFVLTRLVPEMHTVFAAFATSGSGLWGEAQLDVLPTGIHASLYSVLGTQDEKVAEGTGYVLPFPIEAEAIAADPLLSNMIANTTGLLSLEPTHEAQSEPPWFTTLTFRSSPAGAGNQYIFRMVNRMGHVYPSGDNNRAGLNVADVFWDFFTGYALP